MISRLAPRRQQVPGPEGTRSRGEKEIPHVRSVVEEGDSPLSSGKAADASPAAAVPSTWATSQRSLVFEYADYRVSVSEDGTVALSGGKYACAARLEGPSVDPSVSALFALASPVGLETRGGTGSAAGGIPLIRLVMAQPATGREAPGTASWSVPAGEAVEIEKRLKDLLRDRYLALMESRCGPAPVDLGTP
jgi:hypothetical protein